MPECAKTHLQQYRISKFFRGGPPPGSGEKGQGWEWKGDEGRGGERRGKERNRKREWRKKREGRRRPLASGPKTIIRHCSFYSCSLEEHAFRDNNHYNVIQQTVPFTPRLRNTSYENYSRSSSYFVLEVYIILVFKISSEKHATTC